MSRSSPPVDQAPVDSAPVDGAPVDLPVARSCPFDPPAEYTALRAGAPVTPLRLTVGPGEGRGWLVSRLAEARAVLSDRRFSHRNELIGLPIPPPFPMTGYAPPPAAPGAFGKMDQPGHGRYRRHLNRYFTMRAVAELAPMVRRVVDSGLDRLAGATGPVDLVTAFADPVAVGVTCELLGVPHDARDALAGQLAVLARMSYPVADLITACEVISATLTGLVERERGRPGTGLLGDLVRAGGLSTEELVNIAWGLAGGGFDTTANMLALGTFALLEHPDQLALLRGRPELIDGAVEELMRYLTVSHLGASRAALEDVELAGTRIRTGDTVVVALPAANRDPAHFPRPDQLDVTATAQGHLAFGHGPHQCLGQHFARLVLRTGYPALFDRFPTLRLAVPAENVPLRTDMLHYGVHELPVTWDR